MAAISLLVVASIGAVCAQSQDAIALGKPVAADNFISIGPIGDKPVLMAEAIKPIDQQPDSENKEDQTLKPQRPKINYGLMMGVFSPTNSDVKNLFGSSWLRIGIRPLPRDLPQKYRVTFDTSYYAMARNYADLSGNIVFKDEVKLIPITVGVLRGFNQGKNTRGYIAFNAGPYYGSIKAPSVGIDEQKWGLNANATAGIIFSDTISVEGRYEYMQKLGGFDFSAFTISASYRIFSARM